MADGDYRDFWDAMYRRQDHCLYWEEDKPSADFIAAFNLLELPAASSILDIGCGTGLEACWMAAAGMRVNGIDISHTAIELARQRARQLRLNVSFQQADALAQPFADDSFSLATDRGCLHLIPHAKWPDYATEVARLLQPGASLLLRGCSDADNPGFHALLEELLLEHFAPAGFSLQYARDSLLANSFGGLPARLVLLRLGESSPD